MPSNVRLNKKMGKEELQNHLVNKKGGHVHSDKTKKIYRKMKYKGEFK